MVVSLSKDATLATIAAFVVFATPFTLMRAADFEGSATHGVAQRWSLASCCVHWVALVVFLLYVAWTPADASNRACYVQETILVSLWATSTWSLYIFQYYKQRVVTMALPGAREPLLSRVFKVLAFAYAPVLIVGMPFWVSEELSDVADARHARHGMCPWVMRRRWRPIIMAHFAADSGLSLVSLFLFLRPILVSARNTKSTTQLDMASIARRNAAASLVAMVSTLLQTTAQFAWKVGERSPFLFWLVISQDLAFNIVSICLSYALPEALVNLIRLSRTEKYLRRWRESIRAFGHAPSPRAPEARTPRQLRMPSRPTAPGLAMV